MIAAEEVRRPFFLGIEGGGTRTVALLVDRTGRVLDQRAGGPANLRLVTDRQLRVQLRTLTGGLPRPDAICVGLAGARTISDRERIQKAAGSLWKNIPCAAVNDLETALAAGRPLREGELEILVLSGTGSCCFGKRANGQTVRVGGWGHLIGDKGSGYEIGLRALKAVVYHFDREGVWPDLGARLLRVLQLNRPDDLVGWIQNATKTEVAALAVEVFTSAEKGEKIARDILAGAASSLARDAIACARRLGGKQWKKGHARFVLAGSVLLRQRGFAAKVARLIRAGRPGSRVGVLQRDSVWGAVELARRLHSYRSPRSQLRPAVSHEPVPEENLHRSPTEQRHPGSRNLDKLPLSEAIELMLAEDEKIPGVLRGASSEIAEVTRMIVQSFRRGGRLFYVGAGTSGRLGVLDASECPPTFRTPPEMVQGIIAGGQKAIWSAVEGAEDQAGEGAEAIRFRKVKRGDVVIGIAASGRTPFVLGALRESRRVGAKTVLLCFNPGLKLVREQQPDVLIAPAIGPEILTGSTRLKAGTATKLVLNIFTTLAMVQTGKVVGNLMIDLNASNVKLRDRATRIVQELAEVGAMEARRALERARWKIKDALRQLQ